MESERRSELVAAARQGDTVAFAELVEPLRPRLHAAAARVLGDRDEAEDVVQEALLHAYLGLTQLRDSARFGAWLAAIVVNVARMAARRRGARERALARAVIEPAGGNDDTGALVRASLDSLPATDREVVVLHYVDGLSCEEIGAVVGRSSGAVRVRLHRARARLRGELAAFAFDDRPDQREENLVREMRVEDVLVRMSANNEVAEDQRIVLLKEADGDRLLPIWVGAAEGNSLAFPLRGEPSFRPMTSDLLARVVEVAGWHVDRVVVTRLEEKTFYASISLSFDGRVEELDARPSDALNLAVRTSAPIAVADEVLDEGGVRSESLAADLEQKERDWRGEPLPEGEWRSLSADLLRALLRLPR